MGLLGSIAAVTVDATEAARPAAASVALSVEGKLVVVRSDDFANRRSELWYFIEDQRAGRTYRVKFSNPPSEPLRSGQSVRATGRLSGDELSVDSGLAYLADEASATTSAVNSFGTTVSSGDQKTILLLADFSDATLQCSVTQVRNLMFTDPNGQSIDALYRATSEGRVSFSGDVAGPYKIPYASTGSCDVAGYQSALESRAQTAGIDLSKYARKVFVLPNPNQCPFAGAASLGDNPSRAWIAQCALADTYAHELGHNLGLDHASTPTSEYADTSDFMGAGYGGLRQVNAAHYDQMAWRTADRVNLVTASGRYDVAPAALGSVEALAPSMLKLRKADTGEYYYVSYRRKVGFDSTLQSQYVDKVSIHRFSGSGGRSYLLSVLGDGQSFNDTINGLTITVLSHTNDYATVDVKFGTTATTCVRSAPALTVSPSSQSGGAGASLAYGLTVRNNDSAGCAPATFGLAATGLPADWSISLSPGSLMLSPGVSGSANLILKSATTTVAGTYTASLVANDASVTGHAVTRSADATVTAACTVSSPAVTLSPASQSGAAGSRLDYAFSITNRDSSSCASRQLSFSATVPSGWTGSLSTTSATMAPGATLTGTLSAVSPANAVPADYSVKVVARDASGTTVGSAAAIDTVTGMLDTSSPSQTKNLAATVDSRRLRVSLSWSAAVDNVGVVAYIVQRDGVAIGRSDGTWFLDGTVAAGGNYSYRVQAVDAAGNVGILSDVVLATLAAKGKKAAR